MRLQTCQCQRDIHSELHLQVAWGWLTDLGSVYDMNAQALDHMYVSPALAESKHTKYEHLHLNTWAAFADMVSDHDPSVAQFNVCDC
jgi:hypothetical protein